MDKTSKSPDLLKQRHRKLTINIRRKKRFKFFKENRAKFYSRLNKTQSNDHKDWKLDLEPSHFQLETRKEGQTPITIERIEGQYQLRFCLENDTVHSIFLEDLQNKSKEETIFIVKSLLRVFINDQSDFATRLNMIIFVYRIFGQLIQTKKETNLDSYFYGNQIRLVLEQLLKIPPNQEKLVFWTLHFLMKVRIFTSFLQKSESKSLVFNINQVLDSTDSLRVFELICDFIQILHLENTPKDFKDLILSEKSSFVSFLMNVDSKIMAIIQQDINVGFKGIVAASIIISHGSHLQLLTSAQNCFINALTIFKSLGLQKHERRERLSSQEEVFVEALLDNSEDLKHLLQFFLTYSFIVQNNVKNEDLFVKNLCLSSIKVMLGYGALEVRKRMLWLLSNIFIDIPVLQVKRW